MNVNLKDITKKIRPLLSKLQRYATFIFIVSFLFIYTFLVIRINILNRQEPNDDAVSDKLKTVQRPKIDKDTLAKIQELQDQNVEVQALFKQARDNPFSE
jgi:hypothetical protein